MTDITDLVKRLRTIGHADYPLMDEAADLIQRQAEELAAASWQLMGTAPKDGKHVILAVKSGAFVYAVQGAFLNGKWMNAADIKSDPLCWRPNVRIPDEFLPWLKSEGSQS